MLSYPFQFWTTVPILMAAPAQTLFVLLYGVRRFGAGEWWKDFVGRALFVKSVSLAFVLDAATWSTYSVWHRGGFTGVSFDVDSYRADYSWLLVIGYWLVAFAVYFQLASLIKQRFSFQKRRM